MKNKLLRLILVLGAIFIGTTAVGCKIGSETFDDIINNNELVASITYYANGGWFNNDNTNVRRNIYYKENAKAYEITAETEQFKVKHVSDVYVGWFNAKTANINGDDYFVCDISVDINNYKIGGKSVIIEKDGQKLIKINDYEWFVDNNDGKEITVPLLAHGEQFDFVNSKLTNGDKIYLVAKWVPDQKVEYVLLAEDCSFVTITNDGETSVINNGEIVATRLFDSNGEFQVSKLAPADSTDATFVDYYVYSENPDLDNLVRLADQTQTLLRPDDGSNIKVFVKYVAGAWEIVRSADDVKSIFSAPMNKYYLTNNVDCSELDAITPVTTRFRGTVQGNGYTISGLKVQTTRLTAGSNVALFGEMTNVAVIKDLTFKDITLTCTTRPDAYINVYLIAHTLSGDSNPTLSNVKFDGVELNITLANGSSIGNIPLESMGYNTNTWLVKDKTNSQFFSEFETVSLENYQIIINNTIVATDISEA